MLTGGLPSKKTVIISHINAQLSEISCIADYLDDCTEIPAKDLPREDFNVEVKNVTHVVSAGGILNRISGDFSRSFREEVLLSLHSSTSTSSDHINEVPEITKCIEKFKLSARGKPIETKNDTEANQ